MHADGGPARQQQRLLEELSGLLAPALGQADLGQPLQAVRLAADRVDVRVQRDRLEELQLRAGHVAHHERRLPDEGGREGHPPQGAGLAGAAPKLLGLGDDLGIGLAAVEQVLRHAQVGVEDGAGQAVVSLRASQLGAEAREPLPTLVRQQPLQPHQVDQVPWVVDPAQPLASLGGDLPRRLHVAGEVRQGALGEQQRRVGLVVLELQPGQGASRAVARSPPIAAARARRARTSRCWVPVVTRAASAYASTAPGSPSAISRSPRRASSTGRCSGPACSRTPSTRASASR